MACLSEKANVSLFHSFLVGVVTYTTNALLVRAAEVCTNEDIASIIDEAVIMADFRHAHVLALTGVAVDDDLGLPILVMPYMTHGDLNSYLRRFRYDPELDEQVWIHVSEMDRKKSGFAFSSAWMRILQTYRYLCTQVN